MVRIFSTSCNRRTEHVGIEAVIIAKLKLSDVERHIFSTHLVVKRLNVRRLGVQCEYRPKRTHLVTTGLDPVVHSDIRRMRQHGETERADSLHGLPDQVRQ